MVSGLASIMHTFQIGRFALAAALLAPAGCTNLSQVRDFAALSLASTAQFDLVVDDLEASAQRTAAYTSDDVSYAEELPGMRYAHRVLEDYLLALAELASDELVEFRGSYDALAGEVQGLTGASAGHVKAASNLAALLTKAATDGYRRSKIRTVIGDANPDVAALCAGLKQMVALYDTQLERELEAVRRYHQGILAEVTPAPPEPGAAPAPEDGQATAVAAALKSAIRTQVELALREASAARARRAVVAEASKALLAEIAARHQDLFDHRSDLDAEELKRVIRDYRADVEELRDATRRAQRGVVPRIQQGRPGGSAPEDRSGTHETAPREEQR